MITVTIALIFNLHTKYYTVDFFCRKTNKKKVHEQPLHHKPRFGYHEYS